MKLTVSSSPHIHDIWNRQKVMFSVVIALLPALVASLILFWGTRVPAIIGVSLLTAILTDIAGQRLTNQDLGKINGSAVVTGLLFAFVLPPTTPLWASALGAFISVALGKYAFGMGNNIFNPALVGRAFLVASWGAIMTDWMYPGIPDGITQATPLAVDALTTSEQAVYDTIYSYSTLFFGHVGGCIGETSAFALIAGGIFLIALRIIDWRIPATYIGAVGLITLIAGKDPLFHILSGGLLIGAFFMATDYVTIPLTTKGRVIFALGCGIITSLFRLYSATMPEGVMYSILLMNAAAPLIERFTLPKPYGTHGNR